MADAGDRGLRNIHNSANKMTLRTCPESVCARCKCIAKKYNGRY